MSQLVEMVVKWRGETKVLVELVTEQFRQAKIARSMQATLLKQLYDADWDRYWDRQGRRE